MIQYNILIITVIIELIILSSYLIYKKIDRNVGDKFLVLDDERTNFVENVLKNLDVDTGAYIAFGYPTFGFFLPDRKFYYLSNDKQILVIGVVETFLTHNHCAKWSSSAPRIEARLTLREAKSFESIIKKAKVIRLQKYEAEQAKERLEKSEQEALKRTQTMRQYER